MRLQIFDNNNKRVIYKSISECAIKLNISRNTIKICLVTGKYYKGYNFVLN